jgi:hypothetical protein
MIRRTGYCSACLARSQSACRRFGSRAGYTVRIYSGVFLSITTLISEGLTNKIRSYPSESMPIFSLNKGRYITQVSLNHSLVMVKSV